MRSSVGFEVIGGGGGKQERSGGCGCGGGKGKRGAELTGVGDGRVGILGIEREAESWWDSIRVSSSSCADRRVVSGSRVSSSVSEWEGSEGESVGEGSRGLGKNQQGLRVGCHEMVGDYFDDSSVEENLNLLLRLAWVETSIDSKMAKEQGILEGRLQGTQVLGASSATLSNNRLRKRFRR